MKKKVVEVAVFRTLDGLTEAEIVRVWGKDGISIHTYGALTPTSIGRLAAASNKAGGRVYAEASLFAVGFRMMRR